MRLVVGDSSRFPNCRARREEVAVLLPHTSCKEAKDGRYPVVKCRLELATKGMYGCLELGIAIVRLHSCKFRMSDRSLSSNTESTT